MGDYDDDTVVRRRKKIIEDLDEIDDIPVSLVSTVSEKTTKDKKQKEEEEEEQSDWLMTLSSFKVPKYKPGGKGSLNEFYEATGNTGKKKKKKKKKGELTDYNREFEPELNLLNNLLREQNRFVDALQSKFNTMETGKSSTRGIGKFTIDLADSISTARSLSSKIVNDRISLKKSIADLTFKEKKEFGAAQADASNLDNYAANYLKKLVSARGSLVGDVNMDGLVSDGTEDDLLAGLTDYLGEDTRDPEVSKYLEYEKRNVKVSVIVNPKDYDDYDFVAEAEDGEVIIDYPLPQKTRLTINNSTMIATDAYGKKYEVEFRGE